MNAAEGDRLIVATGADWERARDLRLEMLEDTPIAYGHTLAEAQQLSDDDWRRSGARADEPGTRHLAAVAPDGRWIGQLVAKDFGPVVDAQRDLPGIFAVYLTPSARGRGLIEAMLDDAAAWLRLRGHDACALMVRDDNDRARRAYERYGFVANGVTCPNPLDPTHADVEMVLDLAPSGRQ